MILDHFGIRVEGADREPGGDSEADRPRHQEPRELGPAGPVRGRRRDRLRRQPGGVRLLHRASFDVHHIPAAITAFCVAVTNNFLWNRHWTFDHAKGGHAGFQAARFFTVSVLALGINLIALQVLIEAVEFPELAAQAIAVAFAMPFNFIGNKLWTFA